MPSIDIRTTQNVTIEYELASLRDRFFAFFIDLVLYMAAYYFVVLLLSATLSSYITGWGEHFIGLMTVVGFMGYHLLSEVFANGQSLGKKALSIKVVRLDGREPGLSDYLLRAVFLLVDFILSLGVLAAVLIGSTFKSQRLGDLAANTAVIRVKSQLHFHLKDILGIQSIENYEPQYPAVRQLREADILLIKNLLMRHQTWRNEAHAEAIAETVQTLCRELNIEAPAGNKIEFLKTVIRDYIVLTR